MPTIEFYRQHSGSCPVVEFLDSLDGKQARKVVWVLDLVRTLPRPPTQYFKKLVGTNLWEVRAEFGGDAFRLLGFFDGQDLIVLASGFAKKARKHQNRKSKRQRIE